MEKLTWRCGVMLSIRPGCVHRQGEFRVSEPKIGAEGVPGFQFPEQRVSLIYPASDAAKSNIPARAWGIAQWPVESVVVVTP